MVDLGRLVSRTAAWYSSAVAVIDGDEQFTFAEVEGRSNRLANAFRHMNDAPGTRVALLMSNRHEFIEADLALIKTGNVKVPINPRLTDAEREYILSQSGAEILLVEDTHAPFVAAALKSVPTLKHVIAVGHSSELDAPTYEEVLGRAATTPPRVQIDDRDPSFILYTSGTTGRPKGAVSSFRGRLAATLNMLTDELDVRPGDGMVHVGPLSHGSGSKILAYYLRGARNILVRKFEPRTFFDVVERHGATGSFMVPTMIGMLVDDGGWRQRDLRSLKTVSYGGAPIAPGRLRDALGAFGAIFVQVYGSCEAPHPVTVLTRAEHTAFANDDHHLSSMGREVMAAELRIIDKDGEEVREGEPGELLIRSSNVMIGYWQNETATAEAFTDDGFYRSGDTAVRDDDGYLYMVDRIRDLIITGGLNVYPAEVEAALLTHPSVAEAAVIGVPDTTWGENVWAYVVLRQGTELTAEALIQHCRTRLASYKKPKVVEFVHDLPKGSTGKILKRELRDGHWADRGRAV